MNYVILTILLAAGIFDIFLSVTARTTISQAYQKLFRTWIDIGIFAAGLAGLCVWHYYQPELDFTLAVVMAGVWGHIVFPNKERYKYL
ncbi:hypothetical protein LCGC14_1530480 [marine sediment metagenome]|uniref:Uncharacterized protein n=1 Tax=marine sediment metagenome TaxID=412755 RepID=A0A0F9JGU3_9ZZZZ